MPGCSGIPMGDQNVVHGSSGQFYCNGGNQVGGIVGGCIRTVEVIKIQGEYQEEDHVEV